LLWSQHSRRLEESLVALCADRVVRLPNEHQLCELLDADGHHGPARLQVVVVRRVETLELSVEASASPCDVVGPALTPARLTVESWPSAPPLAGHKTLARLAWDLARERAQHAGYDDALLVDSAGNLLETSIANVFLVRDGVVRTPHAPTRCLPGVMRSWLLEHLGRVGMSAEVCELTVDDLASADEVWLSNAVIGVRRIGSVDDRRWVEWPHFEVLASLGIPAPGW
jgi:branched-subunit amino acid aminotransferase/4-amino-4-deoxychorismate lyase